MMSPWGEVFLGVIAFSTLVTAAFHVGVLVVGLRTLKRVNGLLDRAERRLTPAVARLDALGDSVSQGVGAILKQVGRGEGVLDQLGREIERTGSAVRSVVTAPSRQGNAVVAGARAIVERLRREMRERTPASHRETPGPRPH
jgi:hypothetical protein